MKKWLISMVATAVLLASVVAVSADRNITIKINEQVIQSDVAPQIVDGRVLVPIRVIAEALGKEVSWVPTTSEVLITDKIDLLTDAQGVQISGKKQEEDVYFPLIIETRESKRTVYWSNVTNPTYAPQIFVDDFTGNGEQDVLVILTSGYGTGVLATSAHVFSQDTFYDYLMEEPSIFLLKHVKTNMNTNTSEIEIKIDDQTNKISFDEISSPRHLWFDSISLNATAVRFFAEGNIIKAEVPLWISPAEYLGSLIISYTFEDGFFQGDTIQWKR